MVEVVISLNVTLLDTSVCADYGILVKMPTLSGITLLDTGRMQFQMNQTPFQNVVIQNVCTFVLFFA